MARRTAKKKANEPSKPRKRIARRPAAKSRSNAKPDGRTLKRQLADALEQQAAASEILNVIRRSPSDVQPVFDAIAGAALKLCGATSANVFTCDGDLIRIAALVSVTAE